jgi:pimeloyl-ACP methyl ester carboxylesterase
MPFIADLTFEDQGRGPSVVLLHDSFLGADCWHAQIPPLIQAGFRVIRPDFSRDEETSGDIGRFSDKIISLLNYLGIGRAAVCGMGMGGTILFDLLERYSARVVGACFIATRPVTDDIHETARRAELISGLERGEGLSVRNELLKMLVPDRGMNHAESFKQAVLDIANRSSDHAILNGLQALSRRKDYTRLLHHLKLPTLVIGGEQDAICHPGHTEILACKLPSCALSINLNAGHLIPLEQPDRFNTLLLDFLLQISPAGYLPASLDARRAA